MGIGSMEIESMDHREFRVYGKWCIGIAVCSLRYDILMASINLISLCVPQSVPECSDWPRTCHKTQATPQAPGCCPLP